MEYEQGLLTGEVVSMGGDIVINSADVATELVFAVDGNVFLTISEQDGLVFNREAFPEWSPDDFTREFLALIKERWDGVNK